MEDSHIALTEIDRKEDKPISVFGVFDGHGGKEVAKFVKLKYPDLLINLESFRKGDYVQALKESFHGIDQLLENEVSRLVVSLFSFRF
jgi:serine/threonine protein phosphatase PrpC